MEWAGTAWGIIVIAGVAWLAVSCVFSVVLGRIIARFGADDHEGFGLLERQERRSPQRVGKVQGTRRQAQRTGSNGPV